MIEVAQYIGGVVSVVKPEKQRFSEAEKKIIPVLHFDDVEALS